MELGVIIFTTLVIGALIKGIDELIFFVKKKRYRKYHKVWTMQHFKKNDVVKLPTGDEYKVIGSHGSNMWVKYLEK
jgi:hypothetical protein